jgi:hypothetical protein
MFMIEVHWSDESKAECVANLRMDNLDFSI